MRINAIITLLIATMLILLLLASTATAQTTRVSAITERYLASIETSRVGPGDSAGTTASESPRPTLQPTPEPEPQRDTQPKPVRSIASRPVSDLPTAGRSCAGHEHGGPRNLEVACSPQVKPRQPGQSRYYSIDDLRRNIHRVAPGGYAGPQFAGMQSESAVWGHLIEHGYTSDQVLGLTQSEALVLHDLTHGGHASPKRNQAASSQPARTRAPTQLPAVPSMSGCANGQCPTTQSVRRRGIFGGLFR